MDINTGPSLSLSFCLTNKRYKSKISNPAERREKSINSSTMNKLTVAVFVLATTCQLVVLGSPANLDQMLRLYTRSDDFLETGHLEKPQRAFANFCLSSRNEVLGEVEEALRSIPDDLFGSVFDPSQFNGRKTPDEVKQAGREFCDKIEQIKATLRQRFVEAKEALSSNGTIGSDSNVTFENVQCFTKSQVLRLGEICVLYN